MLDVTRTWDVPYPVTDPEKIPKQRYYDPGFFETERTDLWPKVWQMACRLEELADVGDWVEYTILGQSVLIVRTAEAEVKAYRNSCRHRGVRLASGSGNCSRRGFVCPFHGWRWNMRGENTFIYGRQIFNGELLASADVDLVPVRLEIWGGCAFINFDDEASPLIECLGSVAERMDARHVGQLKVEWWQSSILPVNWKLAMEAFMEGYHVMSTHPQLHSVSLPENDRYGSSNGAASPIDDPKTMREWIDATHISRAKLSEGMAGMIRPEELEVMIDLRDAEYSEDMSVAKVEFFKRLTDEITRRGRERGLPIFDVGEVFVKYPFYSVEYMFPNYFLLPFYSGMASYRIRPLTEETTLFEIWSLALYPEGEERPVLWAPEPIPHDSKAYPEIPGQDYSNLPLQQLGLHDDSFEYMRLSREKEGLISNYNRLIDGYIAGRSNRELVQAHQIVNGSFDIAIKDIGF